MDDKQNQKKPNERLEKVFKWLNERNITREMVAEKTGIDESSILRIEDDKKEPIPEDFLDALRDAYGINPDYIRGKSKSMLTLLREQQERLEKVFKRLNERNITQEIVAEKAGIDKLSISRIINDGTEPIPEELLDVLRVEYNINPDYILCKSKFMLSSICKQKERLENVFDHLKKRGITQAVIAEKFSTEGSSISRIKNDGTKPIPNEFLKILHDVYDINLDYIFCKSKVMLSSLCKQKERLENVFDYLKKRGITQAVIAEKFGVKESSISRIKNDGTKPIPDEFLKILHDAYDINLDYISGTSDDIIDIKFTREELANFRMAVDSWDTVTKGEYSFLRLRMDKILYNFLLKHDKQSLPELKNSSLNNTIEVLKIKFNGKPLIGEYIVVPQDFFVKCAGEIERAKQTLDELLEESLED